MHPANDIAKEVLVDDSFELVGVFSLVDRI